jgi:hypothetical protein
MNNTNPNNAVPYVHPLSNVNVNTKPIWDGPEVNSPNGGVTQSLLGKFLACPKRFKVFIIDKLKPRSTFNHKLEYGNMFHLCDELYSSSNIGVGSNLGWSYALKEYAEQLCRLYPFSQEEIYKWYSVCLCQFPVYISYWEKNYHSMKFGNRPIAKEHVFCVPYELPSGRTVYLRGKMDWIDDDNSEIWLGDTKTKGEVDVSKIERQLKYDLQTMIYLIALRHTYGNKVKGIRYNVIRRPLSGGKGSIRQTKNESIDQYYNRLAKYIQDEPETYFFRWETEKSEEDIEVFEKETLIPTLERLCIWWDCQTVINYKEQLIRSPGSSASWTSNILTTLLDNIQYTTPFGIPSITNDYGSEYDDYILTGSTANLEECTEMFTELKTNTSNLVTRK